MKIKLRAAAYIAALLPLAVFAGGLGRDSAALSLSMEHFRDSMIVAPDAASGKSAMSTEEGYVEKNGLRTLWVDEFLTGIVDEKTGLTDIHVEARVRYSGQLHDYENATYPATDGTQSARVSVLEKSEKMCSSGDCLYTEHLSFPIDEQVLRRVAADYVPGKATMWSNKWVAKDGSAINGGLSSAEIAGFLAKADMIAKKPAAAMMVAPAPAPSPPAPTTPSALLPSPRVAAAAPMANADRYVNFGLDGIALAATPEMPNRAGLLIIAVTRGSVAQRAGVIAGDVLFEFDQTSIRTLDDLHAALTGTSTGTRTMLKLFRGTEIKVIVVQF